MRLSRRAALADHDRLLAVALDQDLLADGGRTVRAVLPRLGLDRGGIRQLLVELVDDLLAGQLGRDHPVGGIRHLVLGVEPGTFGQRLGEGLLDVGDAIALRGADHEHLVGLEPRAEVGDKASSLSFRMRSILLRTRNKGWSRSGEIGDDALDPGVSPASASITSTIRSASPAPAPGRRDHRPVEPPLRLENARRIDQQDLRFAMDRDAHQPRARRLRLGADDRDLLPDQRIDQRRLARIGRADHRDKARAGRSFNCSSSAAAAAVSASCLLILRPPPRQAGTETRTVKLGAWWAPVRATSS